jgi:hypothetical protein
VHHLTVTVVVWCVISFLFWRIRPLVLGIGWRTGHCPVHTGQSGVPNRPLLRATRRPRIAWSTVSSPDSPVHHRTVRRIIATSPNCFFRERRIHRGRLTRQSSAPPDSPMTYSRTPPSSPESGLFTRTSLAHRTLSGAPPDSPVCQAELEFVAHSHLFFQFFSHCS